MYMNDEHTVVPETTGKMTDFEIEIEGEWVNVNDDLTHMRFLWLAQHAKVLMKRVSSIFWTAANICTRACAVNNSVYALHSTTETKQLQLGGSLK